MENVSGKSKDWSSYQCDQIPVDPTILVGFSPRDGPVGRSAIFCYLYAAQKLESFRREI